jgi:hypothetical protein
MPNIKSRMHSATREMSANSSVQSGVRRSSTESQSKLNIRNGFRFLISFPAHAACSVLVAGEEEAAVESQERNI